MKQGCAAFWESKSLQEMTFDEWEALCDGCGRCCLYAVEEAEKNLIHYTNVACAHLDRFTGKCAIYSDRLTVCPRCNRVSMENLQHLPSLPDTCAYLLLLRGERLPWWHPLISNDPHTVHEAGISVRGKLVVSERHMELSRLMDYVIQTKKKGPIVLLNQYLNQWMMIHAACRTG